MTEQNTGLLNRLVNLAESHTLTRTNHGPPRPYLLSSSAHHT